MTRLFVSPHLDDAVLSCGELIACSSTPLVVTVFAGAPAPGAPTTPWDVECGFHPGDDPVAVRRAEDRAALNALGAFFIWLDFRDDQYGETRPAAAISAALADVVASQAPDEVYVPLGLFHADHRRTSDAALDVMPQFATPVWRAYADAIYRCIPGAVDARLRGLAHAGLGLETATCASTAGAHARKREAVACYASQLRGLHRRQHHDDVFAPETYWRLRREPRAVARA